ncbi:MAG: hypothetical protein WC532_04920 [Candidatus Omnitrophota bacterium]
MKRAFFVLLLIFSVCAPAFAHPPSKIIISYDPTVGELQALIIHNVSSPESHYIKKIDIGLNGKEIAELEFSRQDNNVTQTLTYFIPNVKPGDTLSVEAYCSISGKLEKEIKVQ